MPQCRSSPLALTHATTPSSPFPVTLTGPEGRHASRSSAVTSGVGPPTSAAAARVRVRSCTTGRCPDRRSNTTTSGRCSTARQGRHGSGNITVYPPAAAGLTAPREPGQGRCQHRHDQGRRSRRLDRPPTHRLIIADRLSGFVAHWARKGWRPGAAAGVLAAAGDTPPIRLWPSIPAGSSRRGPDRLRLPVGVRARTPTPPPGRASPPPRRRRRGSPRGPGSPPPGPPRQ